MKRVLVICGATATGKSALAVKCAKLLNSCVISADSQLIYRGLNIGTAKPTREEMCGIRHEMIDIVPPDARFSVSDFRDAALLSVENELNAGRTPVICGGTGFYMNAILFRSGFGLAAGDAAVRAKYETIAAEKGKAYLHSLLAACDRESAEKLHPNDIRRVIRALEIFELTGRKKSAQADPKTPRYPYEAFCIDWQREILYERIAARVQEMLSEGLVDEVKGLLAAGVPEDAQCMQAIMASGAAALALAMSCATACAVLQAAWKLNPPVTPSMSSTSPAKYSPGQDLLSNEWRCTDSRLIPPHVTNSSRNVLLPSIS